MKTYLAAFLTIDSLFVSFPPHANVKYSLTSNKLLLFYLQKKKKGTLPY
jgi:hypothetical protein